jgi:hypothetical protein
MIADNTPQIIPTNINPVHWNQSLGVARQACAHIFRDGGSPSDALAAFGIAAEKDQPEWSTVVPVIAEILCTGPSKKHAA